MSFSSSNFVMFPDKKQIQNVLIIQEISGIATLYEQEIANRSMLVISRDLPGDLFQCLLSSDCLLKLN